MDFDSAIICYAFRNGKQPTGFRWKIYINMKNMGKKNFLTHFTPKKDNKSGQYSIKITTSKKKAFLSVLYSLQPVGYLPFTTAVSAVQIATESDKL